MNTKKVIYIFIISVVLSIGVTGCMSEKSKKQAILEYLEDRYKQEFVAEYFDKGSTLFPEMYGKSKIVVHPTDNNQVVFISGESEDSTLRYYDNYIIAKWGEELTSSLSKDIEKEFPEDVSFKVLFYTNPNNYTKDMTDMSVFEYLNTINKNADIRLMIVVKCSNKPDINYISKYNNAIFNLYNKARKFGTDRYAISVGFVNSSEDISDYLRTSLINNISWENLDAQVYGHITIDQRKNPNYRKNGNTSKLTLQNPENVMENYKRIGE